MSDPEQPADTPVPAPATDPAASPETPEEKVAAAPAAAASSAPAQPYQAPASAAKGGYIVLAGLVLFLMGLFWRLVEAETGWITSAWLFVSIVMMLVPFAWHAPDFFRAITSRRGGAFFYVVTTIALGVGIAAFVGWVTSGPRKARLPALDLTKSARYTLTEESEKLLDKIPGTVYATYLMQGEMRDEGLREAVLEQLRVYEASSSHIVFKQADETRKPEEAKRIRAEAGIQATQESGGGEDTDILVLTYAEPGKEVAPGKQKEIKIEKWAFFTTSSTGADKWLGESVISDGIYELIFQKYKAYATGGHGERAMGESFRQLKETLTRQNVEVAQQPVVMAGAPRLPEDCEILLVLDPKTPFTPEEAKVVGDWLDKGHTLFLCVDVHDDRATTGLDDLLASFDVATRLNYEVIAPQIAHVNINQQNAAIPQGMSNQFPVYGDAYADHPATKALKSRSQIVTYFVKTTYLEAAFDKPPAGVDMKEVCLAPDAQGFSPVALSHTPDRKNYSSIKKGSDIEDRKLPLIVTSAKKAAAEKAGEAAPGAAKKNDARLVISGDADVFTDNVAQRYPGNLDLARGLVQWGLRRESLVAVSGRTLEDPYVTPTEYEKRFAFWWPMAVILLPLVMGGMVWWSRRR